MRPWQSSEPISASSRCVKVCCFESQVRLVWIYIQWFTQLDALFTQTESNAIQPSVFNPHDLPSSMRCLRLIPNHVPRRCSKLNAQSGLWFCSTLFSRRKTKSLFLVDGDKALAKSFKLFLLRLDCVKNSRTVKLFQRYWLFGIQSFLELDECSLICQLQTNRSAFLGERFAHRNQILFALSFSANVSFRALLRPLYVTLCDTLCKASRYVK